MRKLIIISSILLGSVISNAQNREGNADSVELKERMLAFVTAFNNLNWEEFTSFLDDDATAFLESDTLTLVQGKIGIEKMFRPIFEEVPKNVKGPPYLRLQPLNMNVSSQGKMAVVTFHLQRGKSIARRTFVWKKQQKTWRIIHIHGSVVIPDNN